ncbi:MAG TPA: hypothetical protein VHU92_20680 [Streptosporangiaceae bacterium]|nr:hypothetical protein [Streptosporangiaceae bacterium]
MNTDNERDIRGRLDAALGTIDPPGPPVDAVLRRGRSIRLRRRAAVATGLAAVVGLGIALPGLVGHMGAEPPVRHSYVVNVNPPRSTPSKLTFSGTINGRPWQFEVDWNRGNLTESGPGAVQNVLGSASDMSPAGQPADLSEAGAGSGAGARLALVGEVRSGISYLALNQPGGGVVYLTAIRWHGAEWVGALIPEYQQLRNVVAYSARGEVAYAVPFLGNEVVSWLRPGQHGLARQQARIATGVLAGKRWFEQGYAGPWGLCFRETAGTTFCPQAEGSRVRPGHFIAWLSCTGTGGSAFHIWSGQAAPDISYLRIRMSDGSVQRVVPVPLGGYRFFALASNAHQLPVGWTAYGGSGQVLGAGRISPRC